MRPPNRGTDTEQGATAPDEPVEEQRTPRGRASLREAVSAFAIRDYRILWAGVSMHALTLWMEIVARSWLVWEITEDPVAVGWVNFWRTIPVLFLAIPAGVLADRVNRKTILVVTQIGILGIYVVLLALLLQDQLELWHAYALFAGRGAMIAFNQPGRQALIPAIVGRERIANAVALQQFSFNGTRIVAPLLTGVLIAVSGFEMVFIIIILLEFGIIAAWLWMKTYPLMQRGAKSMGVSGAFRDTWEGLLYVRRHVNILILLLLGLLSLMFLQPFMVLLPPIADERFASNAEWLLTIADAFNLSQNTGATLFGGMLTFMGIGSIIGPSILAYLGNVRNKGMLIVVTMALSGVVLSALGAAPWLILALVLMILLGLLDSSQRVLTNGMLLTQTESEFHGRVISLYLLDRGFVPIGSLVAGYMGSAYGAGWALAILGGALAVSVVIVAAIKPRFLRAG